MLKTQLKLYRNIIESPCKALLGFWVEVHYNWLLRPVQWAVGSRQGKVRVRVKIQVRVKVRVRAMVS